MSTLTAPNHAIALIRQGEHMHIPVGLLSRQQKNREIYRHVTWLYREYAYKAKLNRHWDPNVGYLNDPNRQIRWLDIRKDFSAEMRGILLGFFGVEQYAPSYVLQLIKESIYDDYGRSNAHLVWGEEERKHSDLWYNALLFSGTMTADQLREHIQVLRQNQWELPDTDPMYMVFYTVIQELATKWNYDETKKIAAGITSKEFLKNDSCPILRLIASIISKDEGAHFNFFLDLAIVYLYYYPAEALNALYRVLSNFSMPARKIIPNFKEFEKLAHKAGVYDGKGAIKVIKIAFKALGIKGRKQLESGIKDSRMIPDENGNLRETAIFDGLDFSHVKDRVERSHERTLEWMRETGHADLEGDTFLPNY